MSRKNALLEFWRFVFAMIVLWFHFFTKINKDFFHAGYLGVEFFFLVSGFFIGAYYSKYQEGRGLKERLGKVLSYAWSRLKRLYPFYVLALFLMLFIRSYINQYGFYEILTVIKSCFAEFFLLQWTPIGNEVLISSGWFVPAVFFGGCLYVLLLALLGKIGGYVLAPVISFLIYRYYFFLIGKIDVIVQYHGVLRGIAGIGVGVFIYFLCDKWKTQIQSKLSWQKNNHKGLETACLVLANVIFLSIFVYTNHGNRSRWDFLVICLYGIGLFFFMIPNSKLPEKCERIFCFLGKITYPIYIFQMPIIELILSGRIY